MRLRLFFSIRITLFSLPVLLFAVPAVAVTIPVTILYTADTHGHIRTDGQTVGLDLVAALKKRLPGSILLDAGDFLHGSPLAVMDKGKTVISLMREAGYFAATAGNHEFSHDLPTLRHRAAEAAAFPSPMHVLSANITTQDGSLLLKPWADTTVQGARLCVFGLTTPETKTQSTPSTVASLTFLDVSQTATTMAATLRASGCDLVLALTHIGSDAHIPFTSRDLAAAVPGLDAVIDGHSHRRFAELIPGEPPVVSSGYHGKAVGKLTLSFDTAAQKVVAAANTFYTRNDLAGLAPDTAIHEKIAALQSRVDTRLGEVVAVSPIELPATYKQTRTSETALGNLAADALRAAYGTDIAIINAGSIREGFPKGLITRQTLLASFPFNGYAVSVRVTGKELYDILEHALGSLPGEGGGFPQVSGVSVVFSPTAPAGGRIREIRVAGKKLDTNISLTLATNDFLAQGGDGYPHLAAKPRLQSWMTIAAALVRHLEAKGVTPLQAEGRLREAP